MNTKFLRENGETILEIVPSNDQERVIIAEMQEIIESNNRQLIKLVIENEKIKVVNTDTISGEFLSKNGFRRLVATTTIDTPEIPNISNAANEILIWLKRISFNNWIMLKGSMYEYNIYQLSIGTEQQDTDTYEFFLENAKYCDYRTLSINPQTEVHTVVLFQYDQQTGTYPRMDIVINKIGKYRNMYDFRRFLSA